MESLLARVGLNPLQAKAYLRLLDLGNMSPPELAKELGITRSNAYKMAEKLEALGLAQRNDSDNKLTYQAADPTALASIAAEKRNQAIAAEHAANKAIQKLATVYRDKAKSTIATGNGRRAVVDAYRHQAELKQPIYFLRPASDIPFMGFETMHRIRTIATPYRTERYGITPDTPDAPAQPKIDQHSLLTRTPIANDAYTAPVEWTVSGDELLLIVFGDDGRYIRIRNQFVAQAFRQLWDMLNTAAKTSPNLIVKESRAKRTS